MTPRHPSKHDQARRLGGGEMMFADEWSIREKGFCSPEIEDYRSRVEREFLRFSRAPQERLSWLTIIADPLVVEPGDHGEAVAKSLRDMERKLIARCRRSLRGMKIRGVHEVDVLAPSACRIGRHKADLLRTLGVDVATVASDRRILVPHLHCIVDRADHTPERLAEQMKAEFPGPWRTFAKPLFSDRPLSENLKSLAGYCTKMKAAYSDAWAGRSTKYVEVYENIWIDTLRMTLSSIGLDDLYFSHGGGRLPASDLSLTAVAENGRNPGSRGRLTGNERAVAPRTSLVENVCGDAGEKLNVINAQSLRYRAKLQHLQRSIAALDFADVTLWLPDSRSKIGLVHSSFEPDFSQSPDHLSIRFGVNRASHAACATPLAPISLKGIWEGADDPFLSCGDSNRDDRRLRARRWGTGEREVRVPGTFGRHDARTGGSRRYRVGLRPSPRSPNRPARVAEHASWRICQRTHRSKQAQLSIGRSVVCWGQNIIDVCSVRSRKIEHAARDCAEQQLRRGGPVSERRIRRTLHRRERGDDRVAPSRWRRTCRT